MKTLKNITLSSMFLSIAASTALLSACGGGNATSGTPNSQQDIAVSTWNVVGLKSLVFTQQLILDKSESTAPTLYAIANNGVFKIAADAKYDVPWVKLGSDKYGWTTGVVDSIEGQGSVFATTGDDNIYQTSINQQESWVAITPNPNQSQWHSLALSDDKSILYAGDNQGRIYSISTANPTGKWIQVGSQIPSSNPIIIAITIDSNHNIYAANFNSVYKLIGNQWTLISSNSQYSIQGGSIEQLLIANNSNTLYAIADPQNSIFSALSTSESSPWTIVGSVFSNQLFGAAINDSQTSLYAANATQIQQISTQGGTWQNFGPKLPTTIGQLNSIIAGNLHVYFFDVNGQVYRGD